MTTFIEFADYFFKAANDIDEADRQTAFIRATFNGAKPLLFKMFVANLKYLSPQNNYVKFESEMLHIAYQRNLRAVFYDEACKCEEFLKDQFIQDDLDSSQALRVLFDIIQLNGTNSFLRHLALLCSMLLCLPCNNFQCQQ